MRFAALCQLIPKHFLWKPPYDANRRPCARSWTRQQMSSLKEADAMRTSGTELVIGQSYGGKARFWINSGHADDVIVRLGLTHLRHWA
jgi:hypothetical protein